MTGIVRTIVRRLGPYAPLSASYFRDPALARAKERAELLWVRGIAFCAASGSDGYIAAEQLADIGVRLRGVKSRADTLVREGLWEEVDGGYQIRNWEKWNRTAAELERVKAKDRERKRHCADLPPEPPAPEPLPEEPAPVVEIPTGLRLESVPVYVEQFDDEPFEPADAVIAKLSAAFRVDPQALRSIRPRLTAVLAGSWPLDVLTEHLLTTREGVEKPSAWLGARLKPDRLPVGPSACDCSACRGWRAELDAAEEVKAADVADAARRAQEAAAEVERLARAAADAEAQAEVDARNEAITGEIGPELADALVREALPPKVTPVPTIRRVTLAQIYAAHGWDVGEILAHAQRAADLARQTVA